MSTIFIAWAIFALYCASIICLTILLKEEIFKFLESEEGLIGLLPILSVIALQMQFYYLSPPIYEAVALTASFFVMFKEVNKLA